MKPYIGITGFMYPTEVDCAISCFPGVSPRQLMVGVLASWKSLRGIPLKTKWQKQFPSPDAIADLFFDDAKVLNLIHYSTKEGEESSLLQDMLKIHELAGPNFHGFQLNIPWPEIRLLDEYRTAMGHNFRIVLQVGQKAMEVAGNTPKGLVEMLNHYVGIVDGILLDPSGGYGKPFDTERARELLSTVKDKSWDIGLGVAGGLGPDSLGLVEPLLAEFPDLSIDAQRKLRDSENNLDLNAVKAYLGKALQMFQQLQ